MSSVQTTASRPRQNRTLTTILLAVGAAVLVAGIVVLVIKLTGGSSSPTVQPQAASQHKPTLQHFAPPKKQPLPHIKYASLSPQVRAVVYKFMTTAVPRKNIGSSWNIIAPSLRQGYTKKSWTRGNIPVTMFPVYKFKSASFQVVSKTPKEIHVYVGVAAAPKLKMRPVVFDVGLHKFGPSWKVDYFLAHYTAGMFDANT